MPAFLKSDQSDELFELTEINLIGRSPQASISIDDASVSREHASIRFQDGEYWVHDLGSSNGSYVNELPVTNARRLRQGDRLQFGSLRFAFSVSGDDRKQDDEDFAANTLKTQVLGRSPVGMTTTEAVMLVGDLREFTQLASRMPPDQLAILVRSWYEQTRTVLEKHDAFIDKFIGDAVFAYWKGSETAVKERALAAARLLASGESVTENTTTRRLILERYQVSFECHVGLHVGEVALGTMTRSNYTAVGDAVNKTFRIEAMTRPLKARVLVSSEFMLGMEHHSDQFVRRGSHDMKGYPEPVELYSLAQYDETLSPLVSGVTTAAP